MNDAIFYTAVTMQRFGGHFASAIGNAILLADSTNQGKLIAAFPELMERYGPTSDFYAGPRSTPMPVMDAVPNREVVIHQAAPENFEVISVHQVPKDQVVGLFEVDKGWVMIEADCGETLSVSPVEIQREER